MLKCLILTLVSAVGLWSQAAGTATVVGRITDSSGSIIPGAKVTVVNVETAFAAETITTAEGTYNVPYLVPGNYRLTVETTGFKRYVREGIQLLHRRDAALGRGARSGRRDRERASLWSGCVTRN